MFQCHVSAAAVFSDRYSAGLNVFLATEKKAPQFNRENLFL